MGAGDYVRTDQFAGTIGGFCTGFHRRFDAADIPLDEDGDIASTNLDLASLTLAALTMASLASMLPT